MLHHSEHITRFLTSTISILLVEKPQFLNHSPEKSMMLYTAFPEIFACDFVTCFKKEGSFTALKTKEEINIVMRDSASKVTLHSSHESISM